MTAAAVMLAVALLVGVGPLQVRRRAGVVYDTPHPLADEPMAADPLAAASALDVFAVCLSAGMAVSAAAEASAPAAPPALRAVLQRAADLLSLGADPDTAWSDPVDDPICQSLLRLARRSAVSGSALAAGAAELAEQVRLDAAHGAEAAAQRSGVLIAGPLGLCFLPAFVCLGVIPVVAGLAGEVFGAGLS